MKILKPLLTLILPIASAYGLTAQQVETVVQTGHYAPVTAVCWSPDGKLAATGSSDKTVRLWQRKDGREIRTFQGTSSTVIQLSFSRNSSLLLSVGSNGSVTIWDVATGQKIRQFSPSGDRFTCAGFHPDGTRIATGKRKSPVETWDISTGNKLAEYKAVPENLYSEKGFEYPGAASVMYSADGKFILAGAADQTTILWDAATGKEIRKYKKVRSWCTSCITEAVITSDNKYVISAYSDSVKVFDRESGKIIRELYGQGGSFENLSVSPDGKYVAAVEYGVAEVWELTTGKLVHKSGNYSDRKVLAAAISPDSKELLTGNEKRSADILNITGGKTILTLKGYLNQVDEKILTDPYMYWAALVNEAKLSPDGNLIAVGRTGNNAKLIDFRTGRVVKTLRGHNAMVISVCFSGDGKLVATGGLDGKAFVWDAETGSMIRMVSFPDEKDAIFSVDISSDNKYLVTADWGGLVVLWDISTGQMLRAISPHDRTGVYQVKLLPNNVYFISAGLDKKLKLTEIDTGEEIRTFIGHTDLVTSINLVPGGERFITSSWDGSVRIWDMASGLQVRKINAHEGGVYNAKYDRSGKYIISGGDDFLVRQWDAGTGEMVSEYKGHSGGVGDVNISPDLKHIVSGSRDGTIKVWETASKKELVSITFLNEDDWFIRNTEGYFDASGGAFASISFVRGTELFKIGQFFNEFFRPGLYSETLWKTGSGLRQNLLQKVNESPPPSVEIIVPEQGSEAPGSIASVMVKVTNNGGGVKELRVMHNGKRQDVPYDDLKRMTKAGQSVMKTFEVNLVPGENEISVSACSNGEIESEQASVKITCKGMQKSSDCYVLSIGINRYENEAMNLTYARSDAAAVVKLLESGGIKLFNRINTYTLFDGDATKTKILKALDEISRVMKKEDVFVFFYAGHGSMADNRFYFVTSEITGLYQEEKLRDALYVGELQEKFKLLPALKQVVFVDACQSGGSVEILAMRGGGEEKALAQLSRSSGIHVMASSEMQQQSAEIKSLDHGVFTWVLLEALKGKADGAPADSKVTIYELKSYIDDQVPEVSYRLIRHKQFPITFSIGHDFPLVIE